MRLRILQLFLVVLSAMVFPVCLQGQSLTISSTGENGSGSLTNWSLSGSTLTVTGTANIRASVIENALLSGPLTVVGNSSTFTVTVSEAIAVASGGNSLAIGDASNTGTITINSTISTNGSVSVYGGIVSVNQNLTTTASGASVLLQANSHIIMAASRTIQTNGGDIVLWSNAANRTSGTANNEIVLAGTNILSSSGGKIVLAGGLDDNADGIPDGFAYRGGNTGEAIDIRSNITLNSGGGDIILRGEQNGSAEGIGTDATFTISDAGAVTIQGKNTTAVSVRLGTSTITSTATNAPVAILGTTHLTNGGLVTITTQGGDVVLASNTDDATDGESAVNGQIRMQSGLTITTNGGDITLGGGNATGSSYAMGQTSANIPEGIRFDGSVSLNSGGGNIALRGKTPAVAIGENIGAAGIFFYNMATGSINSGIGTVLLDGYSQTSGGNAIAGLLWWNPGAGTFTIESANTTANAITLNGFSSGASGQAFGIETEAFNTITILATGAGGGITINTGNSIANYYDAVFRGPLNIQAVDGPISLKGGQLGGVANGILHFANNVFLGSKASTSVTSSSSNILIEFDRFDFPGGARYIATSGSVTWQPNAASFGAAIATSWFSWNQNSQTMSGLTIGKLNSTANITHNVAVTVAGPISMYGGIIDIAANLTSSASGDIFLKGNTAATFGDLYIQPNITITKSAGTGTFTAQAKSRIYNNGTISATGTGILHVVLWSDYDNATTGGVSGSGTISTNGGHVWMGGSSTAQGSMTWNGLTVGDGPSVGSSSFNYSGLDLTGNVTTAGGDVLIWAGNGNSAGESGIRSYGKIINAGTGDVILLTDYVNNLSGVTDIVTTGTLTIAPNGNSFATSPFLWNPVVSGTYLDFPAGNFDPLRIQNAQNLTGLFIGSYTGTGLSGDSDFGVLNTSDVTLSTITSIAGPLSFYGGTLTLNESISSTAAGNITLAANTLTFASGKTVTSSGELHLYPATATNTIGIAGATGNLTIPTSYFTNNFTDGFSAIVFGHNSYASNIAIDPFTTPDPLRFQTTGTLTLNGALEMGSNDVTLNSSLTLAGTGYFHTNGAGVVKRTIASAGSFTFPVRDDVTYDNTLVITNNTGAADEFSVRVDGDVLADGTTGTSITDKVVKATWHIGKTSANASSGVDLVFKWHTGQHLNVSDFIVSHFGSFWVPVSSALTPTVNGSEHTLTLSGYTGSFSPFAIGSAGGALPVSWLDVSATRVGQTVQLHWSTASEQNTKNFVVQHSSGNGRWTSIGSVAAAGFSSSIRSYRFTHTQPLDGRNQYRLLQRDLDGRESLSKIVSVMMPSATSVQVYPVPSVNGSVFVKLPADQPLKLLNSQGVPVLEQTGKAGVQLLQLQHLPKGLYYLQAGKETVRIIL